jgi:tetratricopeptide (TPR) repeat protein
MAFRIRWQKSQRILAPINVEPISYNKGSKTTPALYLADTLLGVELLNKGKSAPEALLEILVNITYDDYLESLAICKSQLDTNGKKSLLSVIAEHPIKPTEGEIKQVLVTLFQQDKEPFYQFYKTALRNVNHPHYRQKGLQLKILLDAVHEKSQLNDLRTYLHALQIDMAYHNHTGNIEASNSDWEQYLELEPQLGKLGEQAMEFYTDFRCKRAVNLMDEFRYDEAVDVLTQARQKEENFAQRAADCIGGQPDDFSKERRGWIYSALGQVFAFQGKKEQAEQCFRDALTCFDKKDNIEREWVHLGHLACDFPQDLQTLLNDVFEHLPPNTDPFEEPFILALKLKSVYVFGDMTSQNDWAKQMLAFTQNNKKKLQTDHPWGLIYQITAMLFEKLGNKSQTKKFYDLAINALNKGEGILQELGKHCNARKRGKTTPEKIRFNYWQIRV